MFLYAFGIADHSVEIIPNHAELTESVEYGKAAKLEYDEIYQKCSAFSQSVRSLSDEYIEKYLAEKNLDLTATLDVKDAYGVAVFVVIAAPTLCLGEISVEKRNLDCT